MSSEFPRIALPEPTSTDYAYNRRSLPQYVQAITAAGGVAVPIPLGADLIARKVLVDSCSALLLPGSPADVDPGRYGQSPVSTCAAADGDREGVDNFLLEDAFRRHKPVLGVCFGLQSLNVWCGGSLVQDLPHSPPAEVDHEAGPTIQSAHTVEVTAGSRLAQALAAGGSATGSFPVNSSHHQSVQQPGKGLTIVARCPLDGVIEAIEGVDPEHFVLAAQWHPERSYEESVSSRSILAAFLRAARAWSPAVAE